MRTALALSLMVCLTIINLSETSLAPRGPRPVLQREHYRSKQCSENEWPSCTDDEWGPKCPSGCRMQGLIETENQQNDGRVQEVRQLLENYSNMFGNTHVTVTETVKRIRQTLDGMGRFGDTYYQLVDHLNSRLTILQTRINEQIYKIKLLQNTILEQFKEISRLEVDIDIKIRACKGSCEKSFVYNIDRESNAQMEKNLRSVISIRVETIQYGKPTRTFKIRQLKDAPTNSNYKSVNINDKYPSFWEHTNRDIYFLEASTKVPSSSETSHAFSNVKEVSAVPFSGRKEVAVTTGDETTHLLESDQKTGERYFTKGIGSEYSSQGFERHSMTSHVSTKTIVSKDGKVTETVTTETSGSLPDSIKSALSNLDLLSTSGVKTSTLTKTSTSRHDIPDIERLTVGSKIHTKTITSSGTSDHLAEFSNLGEYGDDSLLIHRELSVRTDEVPVAHDSTAQHWSGSSKGLKSLSVSNIDMHVAHLTDDETGDTDQSAHMFQRG
ncbi:fibrinogen alpha chain-like [Heptranchias perlo]|uniref:fibrinogen alpha chain-like n=1 Tax=Heptranchias perlo TaxID=212740 RepID=UPI00355AB0B1